MTFQEMFEMVRAQAQAKAEQDAKNEATKEAKRPAGLSEMKTFLENMKKNWRDEYVGKDK